MERKNEKRRVQSTPVRMYDNSKNKAPRKPWTRRSGDSVMLKDSSDQDRPATAKANVVSSESYSEGTYQEGAGNLI